MFQRALSARLQAGLADTPVMLLAGPRQSGKSTLARYAAFTPPGAPIVLPLAGEMDEEPRNDYYTLDDANVLSAAQADPQGFLEQFRKRRLIVIDEVQRAPELLVAIKREVDMDRRPGRFILTGSANVMSIPRISESLAGRMEPLALWPLAQCEFESKSPQFLARIFSHDDIDVENSESRSDLLERALRGGFPEAAARAAARRNAWFGAYISTVVQREIKSISAIEDDSGIQRILRTLATRSGAPRNIQTLATDTGIPNTTIQRYVALLQATFLVAEIPAWYRSLDARLVKSPKMLITDSGLYAGLLNLSAGDERAGFLFETFVGAELLRLISFEPAQQYTLMHFRTHKQHEVDFVVERGDNALVGIEVKLTRSVSKSDFDGLRALRHAAGDRFHRGVLLYAGERSLPFGDRMCAVPANALWR
jgi:predicted AAA+ superfamily ATPase